jgi:Ser/Thr protein kinase RdoA (MazF antagonist)
MTTDLPEPRAVLARYDLGDICQIVPAGGTAGRTWRVTTSTGEYFLRLRGIRTSGDERLAFDHGLREHLSSRGAPTIPALRTHAGDRWVREAGRVFEVYPFIHGRPFDPTSDSELTRSAQALAEFHQAAADYRPPRSVQERIAQYTTLGFSRETSDRMDDPALQLLHVRQFRELAGTTEEQRRIDWCLARVERLTRTYASVAYDRLCGWVIHGDYTPANLLFSADGHVAGIFDLDWAMPGPRCRDVAEGLYFFASEPRHINGSSIWSLTDATAFSLDRCHTFLREYHRRLPLSPDELATIPRAFDALWLSIRLEGSAKVPETDRLRFFLRDIESPLQWLDQHWHALMKSF